MGRKKQPIIHPDMLYSRLTHYERLYRRFIREMATLPMVTHSALTAAIRLGEAPDISIALRLGIPRHTVSVYRAALDYRLL